MTGKKLEAEKKLLKTIGGNVDVNDMALGAINLHYVALGKGKPLILIHGANIGLGQWYPNFMELAKHFHVYAIDLPGSGGSSRIDYRRYDLIQESVKLVDLFIEKLHLQKVHLIGHSFGGFIVLKLATLRKPYLDKIIAVDPMGLSNAIPQRQKVVAVYPLVQILKKTALRPTRTNMEKFLLSVMHGKQSLHDAFLDYYLQNVASGSHPLDFMYSMTNKTRIKRELDLSEDISKIQNRVLIISGEKDSMTPIKPLQKATENSFITLELIKNTGHVPSLESPDIFNKLVIAFLK